jgi:hypothetical protein
MTRFTHAGLGSISARERARGLRCQRAVSHMKKATTYLRARDLAGSAAGFIAVLGALVVIDGRVTHHVRNLFARDASGEISAVGDRVQALGQAILLAARDQSIDHAPMLVFTAAAVVLVFFMVRT